MSIRRDKAEWQLTGGALERLLDRLDPDRDLAGQRYESLRQTLAQYDAIIARYQAMPPSTQPSRPFDITEYGKVVEDLNRTANSLNELIKSSDALVASPQWTQRVNEVDSLAQARIRQAITESKGMVGFTTTVAPLAGRVVTSPAMNMPPSSARRIVVTSFVLAGQT